MWCSAVAIALTRGIFRLVFKETLRYGYREETADEPTIYRVEYSFQYQRPPDRFYFRFDHHLMKGDPATHPPYHLHSAT